MKQITLIGLAVFSGICIALLVMPNFPMPCRVTVTREVTRIVPTSKSHLVGTIRTTKQTADYIGSGSVSGGSVVCLIQLPNIGSL